MSSPVSPLLTNRLSQRRRDSRDRKNTYSPSSMRQSWSVSAVDSDNSILSQGGDHRDVQNLSSSQPSWCTSSLARDDNSSCSDTLSSSAANSFDGMFPPSHGGSGDNNVNDQMIVKYKSLPLLRDDFCSITNMNSSVIMRSVSSGNHNSSSELSLSYSDRSINSSLSCQDVHSPKERKFRGRITKGKKRTPTTSTGKLWISAKKAIIIGTGIPCLLWLFTFAWLSFCLMHNNHEHNGKHLFLKTINEYAYRNNSNGGSGEAESSSESKLHPRVLNLDLQETNESTLYSTRKLIVPATISTNSGQILKQYPTAFSDNTQLYHILDSSDEALSKMEMRDPYVDGECVPMKEWQTTFYPTCNEVHELDLAYGEEARLMGTNGFWRDAWKLEHDSSNGHNAVENAVIKTLKYDHNYEDAHYEHNRVDAVAMERLTFSPHIIDIYGFCGHTVFTEFADVPRFGRMADKLKTWDKLRIARDIAQGLTDVHGIDGKEQVTFVHFDMNLANVVSSKGTAKLNDFNIGIMVKRNITNGGQCGFPSKYPNPQWRSPEEALNSQYLNEKVDVYSMGNVLFRLICKHEPWNKLEPNGKPSKEEINEKVKNGELPFIPKAVLESKDYATIAIRQAMVDCYTFDPEKRPSARDITDRLNQALIKAKSSLGGGVRKVKHI